eukprot:436316-Amphidinium_carterae.1
MSQLCRLQVMSFNTESYFDVLIVNGSTIYDIYKQALQNRRHCLTDSSHNSTEVCRRGAHYSGQDSPDGVQAVSRSAAQGNAKTYHCTNKYRQHAIANALVGERERGPHGVHAADL